MPRTSRKPRDITGNQARVARELLALTRQQLSARCKIPVRTILRFEDGEKGAMPNTIAAIRDALEAAGVEFIAENGGGAAVEGPFQGLNGTHSRCAYTNLRQQIELSKASSG